MQLLVIGGRRIADVDLYVAGKIILWPGDSGKLSVGHVRSVTINNRLGEDYRISLCNT